MDKLYAIKIRQSDGTYGAAIPVSVLAENVDWNSTLSLVDILGQVDTSESIQDQINNLKNTRATQASVNALDQKVDNAVEYITHNSEIADAREGADGTEYSTLKERLDSEYNDLQSKNASSLVMVNEEPEDTTKVVIETGEEDGIELADQKDLDNKTGWFVTPETYGAKGDGTTDDTVAFRNMFASNKEVYIPKKSYYISQYVKSSNDCNVISDNATYPNIVPAYPKKNIIETMERFQYVNSVYPSQYSYDESFTYNTKTGKLLIGYNEPNDSRSRICVVNLDTYTIEESYTYPMKPMTTLTYVPSTNKILMGMRDISELYEIDADNMASYQAFSMPNGEYNVCYDMKCHTYIGWTPNFSTGVWTANVYDESFALLYSKAIQLDLDYETVAQDSVAHNNKIYQLTWESLVEVDLVSGEVNRLCISDGANEPEGICFIGEDIYMCSHKCTGYTIITYIYKYNNNQYPVPSQRYVPAKNIQEKDVNLNFLPIEGSYHVRLTDASTYATYHFPTRESDGTLIVDENYNGDSRYKLLGVTQRFVSTNSDFVYIRHYDRINDSWGDWKCITVSVMQYSGTPDSRFGFVETALESAKYFAIGAVPLNSTNTRVDITWAGGHYRVQHFATTDGSTTTSGTISGYIIYTARQ